MSREPEADPIMKCSRDSMSPALEDRTGWWGACHAPVTLQTLAARRGTHECREGRTPNRIPGTMR